MTTAYLVQYGRAGFVGRFRPATADRPARGDVVVVRGPRGAELGVLLCEPAERFSGGAEDGDVLRAATPADHASARAAEARGQEILAAADRLTTAADLPLSFVDVEVSLDGPAVLHALPWGGCDATPILAELTERFGTPVRLLDLSRTPTPDDPPEPAGCGKPGCGSAGGGCSSCGTGSAGSCSTGSCSRGSVKSAAELTAHFAELRQKMEADAAGRTPLV